MKLKFLSSEKIFITIAAIIAMLLNLLPYIYQHRVSPPNKVFIGSYPIAYDKPTYLAEMTQGEAGNWKMINKYTTEPQKPVFLYPLYLGLGHIARLTDISVENVFLISRFFFGILFLFTAIYFIRYFIANENQRKMAYFFALFASGVGWIFKNIQSLDLGAIPEAIPMVRFSYFPHFSVAYILFLASILSLYHSFRSDRGRYFTIISGFLAFILSFVIPFTTIFLYFLAISLLIIFYNKPNPEAKLRGIRVGILRDVSAPPIHLDSPSSPMQNIGILRHRNKNRIIFKNNLNNIMLFFIISAPSLLYMYYLGTSDQIWEIVEKQNILPAPPLMRIFTGYGIILLFSIFGLYKMIKKDRQNALFFSLWIFGSISLTFIPLWIYPMQKRFLENAIFVPLSITAVFGIKEIYGYYKNKKIKFLRLKLTCLFIVIAVPVLIASNIQNWQIFSYLASDITNTRLYLPIENIESMKWLRENTPHDSIILASYVNSNNIPYYADRKVFVGHMPMTADAENKLKIMEDFYSNKYSPKKALIFLKNEGINYIFYSDEEKKSEDGKQLDYFDPANYPFLKEIYGNEKVKIYKIE